MLPENFDTHLITGDPESPSQALSLLKVFSTQEISLLNPFRILANALFIFCLGIPTPLRASLLKLLVHSSADRT